MEANISLPVYTIGEMDKILIFKAPKISFNLVF